MKRLLVYVSAMITLGSGLSAAIVACGGATEEGAAPGDGSTTSSTSSTSGGGSSTSGGSTSSGGSTTSSSGGATDGGVATDGSTTTDGGGTSSGGTPSAITCGTATCNGTTQKCCTTFQQGTGVVSTCIAKATDCQGAEQACDDKADCPAGQICCAGGGGGGPGGGFGASCQTTCSGIQMCKAANECTDGGTCQTYTCFNRTVSLCRKPQFGCN